MPNYEGVGENGCGCGRDEKENIQRHPHPPTPTPTPPHPHPHLHPPLRPKLFAANLFYMSSNVHNRTAGKNFQNFFISARMIQPAVNSTSMQPVTSENEQPPKSYLEGVGEGRRRSTRAHPHLSYTAYLPSYEIEHELAEWRHCPLLSVWSVPDGLDYIYSCLHPYKILRLNKIKWIYFKNDKNDFYAEFVFFQVVGS